MEDGKFMNRLRARFEAKIVQGADGHQFWNGLLDPEGYGLIWVRTNYRRAHRIAWLIYRGAIPTDKQVLHRCDLPGCVQPDHLFLGTHTDNMRDKSAKGRWRGNPLNRRELTCARCLAPFEVRASRANKAKFCSLRCRWKARELPEDVDVRNLPDDGLVTETRMGRR
jgi:hypothetical protein